MTRKSLLLASFIASIAAVSGAHATEFGHHPAVHTAAAATSVDANTFIVLPPASTAWTRRHANAEHPAVAAARLADRAPVDPNAFIVQPPASVTWTIRPSQIAQPGAAVAVVGLR